MRKTCIACPRGCTLDITTTGEEITVTGHKCPRGKEYGEQEAVRPMRTLTTTVRTTVASRPRLPVRTSEDVPLRTFASILERIESMTVSPGVCCGDVIVSDVIGLGTDIVATDDL